MHADGKKMAKWLYWRKPVFQAVRKCLIGKVEMGGASGFEPPTSWSRTRDLRRATLQSSAEWVDLLEFSRVG
jgi:hypothetical protein